MTKIKLYLLAAGGAVLAFLGMLFKIKRLEKKAVETQLRAAETQLELTAKSTEKLIDARRKGEERLNEIRNSDTDIDL